MLALMCDLVRSDSRLYMYISVDDLNKYKYVYISIPVYNSFNKSNPPYDEANQLTLKY